MYKSPIETITSDMTCTIENEMYKIIRGFDISVDKEELVKALQYDRNQYDTGYRDGYKQAIKDIIEKLREEL